jgi:AGZA family xanthine/uracil permease-like MFS transporter
VAGSYIVAVNASIVADSGGTCVCNEPVVNGSRCEKNTEYNLCKADIKRDLVTATAAISALGTFCMGLFSNMYVDGGRRSMETAG